MQNKKSVFKNLIKKFLRQENKSTSSIVIFQYKTPENYKEFLEINDK